MTSSVPARSLNADGRLDVQVSLLNRADEFAAIGADWNRLAREQDPLANGLDATSSFEWFETLADTFLQGRTVRLVVARRAGRVVGLLPVELQRESPFGQQLQLPQAWSFVLQQQALSRVLLRPQFRGMGCNARYAPKPGRAPALGARVSAPDIKH